MPSPEQAAERRQEQRQLLTRLADTARQAQVDLVFLAGDLFDGQRARPKRSRPSIRSWRRLEAEVFLSPRQPRPLLPHPPYGKFPWPDHVHIFTQAAPARVEVPQLGAVVYGSAFTSLYRMDSPWPASTPRRRTWPLSAAFMGTSPPPTAATAPSPTMKLPPRACTIWPWATATAPAA